MAAIFFDTSKEADLDLLHSSVRTDDELNNVVDQVEWEIINYYSQRPSVPLRQRSGLENLESVPPQIEVRLIDYNQDTPADSDAKLKDALRRTIGDVASWVLRNYSVQQGAHSIRQGQRSVSFGSVVPSWREWPSGWNGKLKNYDEREANFSI